MNVRELLRELDEACIGLRREPHNPAISNAMTVMGHAAEFLQHHAVTTDGALRPLRRPVSTIEQRAA
jgi:hypothetical protein